jgi:IS30 family transposase
MAEREEISRGVAAGRSCRLIAARLGRAPSTVSRELASNGGRHHYRAQAADAAAFGRALRPKPAKLAVQPRLRAVVEAKLALRWSPQQIAGWLPLAYPSDPVMRVSHETIYLSLFVQSRGALRRELQRCLRTGRAMRYPRAKRLPQGRGQLRDTLHISQRPHQFPYSDIRSAPGHALRVPVDPGWMLATRPPRPKRDTAERPADVAARHQAWVEVRGFES